MILGPLMIGSSIFGLVMVGLGIIAGPPMMVVGGGISGGKVGGNVGKKNSIGKIGL
jgi:hypothetical protein